MSEAREDAVVRTVTCFVALADDAHKSKDAAIIEKVAADKWKAVLVKAADVLNAAKARLNQDGYVVQTLRIVTNSFVDYLNVTEGPDVLQTHLKALQSVFPDQGGLLFHLGAADCGALSHVGTIIEDYGWSVCANIGLDECGVVDQAFTNRAAEVVLDLSKRTKPCCNFNFTVNFNCQPQIPYFPAAYNTSELKDMAMAAGIQMPSLLVEAVEKVAGTHPNVLQAFETRTQAWAASKGIQFYGVCMLMPSSEAMLGALQSVCDEVTSACTSVAAEHKVDFNGVDTSPAPGTCMGAKSIVDLYKLLGVRDFGCAGTLETSAFITSVLKTPPHVGFSGLMLPPTEDSGLASAVGQGYYNIHNVRSPVLDHFALLT